ncbi:MAG: PAS domain-containing sensor histidine kinase, partial [Victivallales bacterium]|nr:PAS domain-containing sensor histidine kinase [Victivallales bacterium]
DGGQLFIIGSTDNIYLNIKFIDTGKGISEEEMRQILDPYFTTKSSGTGLGLLIVDRIIRAHGGVLTIEGEPGKGAAFTVSLPLQVRQTRLLN